MSRSGGAIAYASELSRAARKAREWTIRRDELIREMGAEGMTLRGIAKYAELSHTAVANILAR